MDPVGSGATSTSLMATVTSPAITEAGVVLGTATYMSPEQARGMPVGAPPNNGLQPTASGAIMSRRRWMHFRV